MNGDDQLRQMSEDELLRRARLAMTTATKLPPGSLGRAVAWATYDSYSGELRQRAIALVVALSRRDAR